MSNAQCAMRNGQEATSHEQGGPGLPRGRMRAWYLTRPRAREVNATTGSELMPPSLSAHTLRVGHTHWTNLFVPYSHTFSAIGKDRWCTGSQDGFALGLTAGPCPHPARGARASLRPGMRCPHRASGTPLLPSPWVPRSKTTVPGSGSRVPQGRKLCIMATGAGPPHTDLFRVYVCTCVRVYVCACVRVHVCTCVRVYVCTCVCMCSMDASLFRVRLASCYHQRAIPTGGWPI